MSASSWVAPIEARFVERLAELTKKGDHKTKGHRSHFLCCDTCLEPTWIGGLTDTTAQKGVACRMTPGCPGRHRLWRHHDELPMSRPKERAK